MVIYGFKLKPQKHLPLKRRDSEALTTLDRMKLKRLRKSVDQVIGINNKLLNKYGKLQYASLLLITTNIFIYFSFPPSNPFF